MVVRILLDSVFMPVAVVPVPTNSNAGSSQSSPADQTATPPRPQRVGTSPRKSIYFPGAPPAFWKQRKASSVRSARAVTLMCQAIMDHGNFLLVSPRPLVTSSGNPSVRHPDLFSLIKSILIASVFWLHSLPRGAGLLESTAARNEPHARRRVHRAPQDHLHRAGGDAVLLRPCQPMGQRSFSGTRPRAVVRVVRHPHRLVRAVRDVFSTFPRRQRTAVLPTAARGPGHP